MSKLDDLSDRILLAIGRKPGPIVAAIAVLLYAVGGLAVPVGLGILFLGWDAFNLWALVIVVFNLYSTMFAGLAILAWLILRVEARERRHLLEWTTDLRHLNGEEGELLLRELFEREGWTVRHTGSQDRPDGNIDLDMTREGQRAIVQCKFWERWRIGVTQIREFGGTLLREGLQGSDGFFVTIADIRDEARAEAKKIGMTLIDKYELKSRIEDVRCPEPCPICQRPMILDHNSKYGWWFRCVAEGCKGKRHLGKDPGRAVEFLTEPPPT